MCNIERKAGIPADMRTDICSVDPNLCNKIGAFKSKVYHAADLIFVKGNFLRIPDVIVAFGFSDPAICAQIAERYLNFKGFSRKLPKIALYLSDVFVVKNKIPLTVQIEPRFTNKLRPRVIFLVTFYMVDFHNTVLLSLYIF